MSELPLEGQAWRAHAYQKRAAKFLLEHAAGALFLDPGLGKTSITLAALKVLKREGLLGRVLLVAPLRACYNVWPAEVAKWRDFHGLRLSLLHGKHKETALEADADIYVINPEGLEWLLRLSKTRAVGGAHAKRVAVSVDLARWRRLGFDMLVVDELSKFKHPRSQRFKALKQVLGTFRRRWGLTGSPAANGLLDLFGQCYVLDQGRTLGAYITHYRHKYFLPSRDGFSWTLREGAEEEIYARLAPLALRMAAEDYLEMPARVENNLVVDLPPEALRAYLALEDELVARLEAGTVSAANVGAALSKCRQVASGGVYLDVPADGVARPVRSERKWAHLHDAKTDALADLVDELQGSPLLVAYEFEHDLDRLQKRFPQAPHIGGGVTAKRSDELVGLWNAGRLPLLFGHPQSVGLGLNLQEAAHHICWYSLTWDYELYDQFVRRVLRQGNRSSRVFVHHLLARGTVDEKILHALRAKRRGQQALFDALKRLRRRPSS